jgi:hypothetical protein
MREAAFGGPCFCGKALVAFFAGSAKVVAFLAGSAKADVAFLTGSARAVTF